MSYVNNNLDWTKNGELIVNGNVIKGSHVTDLIKDALAVSRKWKPVGANEFYSYLPDIPKSIVHNRDRHVLIGSGSSQRLKKEPPPGFPVNTTPILLYRSTSETDWVKQWQEI